MARQRESARAAIAHEAEVPFTIYEFGQIGARVCLVLCARAQQRALLFVVLCASTPALRPRTRPQKH
jgi:hypothetical protein